MNAPATRTTSSTEARNLRWLLDNLVDEVPGVRSVAVVSSDGLLLLSSDPSLGAEHGQEGFGERKSEGGGAPAKAGGDEGPRPKAPTRRPGGSTGPGAPTGPTGPGGASGPTGPSGPMGPTGVSGQEGTGESTGPKGSSADLATIVSGVGSLTLGAAKLMDGGKVKQTMVAMDEGALFVMTIGDGSLLGVHATPDCDMNVIGYHMALFVGRAGHVLTPELRSELRESMELEK
ncbi:roadblock/LC7 domain-containing protein [Streptomyces iconiensis]|uniref:Roadblock/LC7 domain-containing protein n=1 Tax=Streptomyces iconiensis TaxID=1384038 RepID=A0ABT7A1N6_9ACTN|nr:roadblock/LC7 domain-containing protein [Streptomyces iconiensis]MDJ1135235.1 roadblock/LC7 domain-containing protein [Streptomyces iconiensis]